MANLLTPDLGTQILSSGSVENSPRLERRKKSSLGLKENHPFCFPLVAMIFWTSFFDLEMDSNNSSLLLQDLEAEQQLDSNFHSVASRTPRNNPLPDPPFCTRL